VTLIAGNARRSSGAEAAASAANAPEVAIAQPSRVVQLRAACARQAPVFRRGAAWCRSPRAGLLLVFVTSYRSSCGVVAGRPATKTSDDTIYHFDSSGFCQLASIGNRAAQPLTLNGGNYCPSRAPITAPRTCSAFNGRIMASNPTIRPSWSKRIMSIPFSALSATNRR
jgi:hypothetical protein